MSRAVLAINESALYVKNAGKLIFTELCAIVGVVFVLILNIEYVALMMKMHELPV